jgi:hypothetical protein
MDDHHHHHNTDCNEGRQTSEDDSAPFNADPETVFTVAASVDLGSQNKQYEALPELPATSGNVIRLALRALHGRLLPSLHFQPELSSYDTALK